MSDDRDGLDDLCQSERRLQEMLRAALRAAGFKSDGYTTDEEIIAEGLDARSAVLEVVAFSARRLAELALSVWDDMDYEYAAPPVQP